MQATPLTCAAVFDGDQRAMDAFFRALSEVVMIIDEHQTEWAACWNQAKAGYWEEVMPFQDLSRRDSAADEFLVLNLVGSAGHYRYRRAQVGLLVGGAMLVARARQSMLSAAEFPRSLLDAAAAHPSAAAFIRESLRPPGAEWVVFSNALLAPDPVVRALLYLDPEERYARLQQFGPPGQKRFSRANRGRLMFACLAYFLCRHGGPYLEGALRRAYPSAEASALPMCAKLFPLVRHRLCGDALDDLADHPLLRSLGIEARSAALRAIRSAAADVGPFLVSLPPDENAAAALARAAEALPAGMVMPDLPPPSGGPAVLRFIYDAVEPVELALERYRGREFPSYRQTRLPLRYATVPETLASEMLHLLDRSGDHDELDRLSAWWQLVSNGESQPPLRLVLRGRAPKSWTASDAFDLLARFDEQFVALRFPEEAPLELQATMDLYAARYPVWLCAIPRSNEPNRWDTPRDIAGEEGPVSGLPQMRRREEGDSRRSTDCNLPTSRAFRVGAHGSGAYLFIRRPHLHVLRRLMLQESLTTGRRSQASYKPVTAFPLLSRLYFICSDPVEDRRRDIERERRWVSAEPEDRVDLEVMRDPPMREEAPPVDDASLGCIVAALSHWLRVGRTRVLPGRQRPADDDVTEEEGEEGRRCRAEVAHYVPEPGCDYFPCMRLLHRLADQLERACEAKNGMRTLDLPALEAVRCYLEMLRPRWMRLSVLREMKQRIDASERGLLDDPDLSEVLDVVHLAYAGKPEEEWVPIEWEPYLRKVCLERWKARNGRPRLLFMRRHPSAHCALFNWLLYRPLIRGFYLRDPEFVYRAFCEGTKAHDRSPLSADLEGRARGDGKCAAAVEPSTRLLGRPYAAAPSVLGERFVAEPEPMDALVRLLREAECLGAGRGLRKAVEAVPVEDVRHRWDWRPALDLPVAVLTPWDAVCHLDDSFALISAPRSGAPNAALDAAIHLSLREGRASSQDGALLPGIRLRETREIAIGDALARGPVPRSRDQVLAVLGVAPHPRPPPSDALDGALAAASSSLHLPSAAGPVLQWDGDTLQWHGAKRRR